ncbi:MAG: NAD(P)-dependent glycerol-3-phosphate dehydrogenase [Candidatus Pacebacteria bacterium]|nr:NAD(P)-dependent glycerol-3-phosphate dehydrogenase [Candidatus Paceibacterota bacterium]
MKKQSKNITVLGDGAWGTTIAILLANNGHKVTMWSVFSDYLDVLDKKRENIRHLKGIKIHNEIVFEKNLKKALENSEIVVFGIPSKFFRSVAKKIKQENIATKGKIFLSVAKGIEEGTFKRMSEILKEELGNITIAVLSGPNIAIEVAHRLPALSVAASKNHGVAKKIQDVFSNDYFRVYTSTDVIGVELGGSLKNIIAIVAGISDGLGFGSNAKAAILDRGIVEIQRLGQELGAKRKTFYGLAGLGDLSTTCISPESRNRTLGERIGRGETMEKVVNSTDSVIEGVTTTKAVHNLIKKLKVEMPITEMVYNVLYENKDPKGAVIELMGRKKKPE